MKLNMTVDLDVRLLSDEDLANLSNDAALEIRTRRIVKDTKDPEAKRVYYSKMAEEFGKLRAIKTYMDIEKCGLAQAHGYIETMLSAMAQIGL